MKGLERQIFKTGSTTYFFSSTFFPAAVREDVFKLYSFVRVADDYVDVRPAKAKDFLQLKKLWKKASKDPNFDTIVQLNDPIKLRVVKNLIHVVNKYDMDKAWVDSFLESMQSDLDGKAYKTLDDTLWYIYGSAEVVGLMMARIMGLSPEADEAAKLQGRAMQWINFIRDIAEDTKMDRCYFPAEDLAKFGLEDLSHRSAQAHPDAFNELMRFELQRYIGWQYSATQGFQYIPRRLLIPLRTAVDMYNWTAQKIKKDPFIVFHKKVKPRKRRIIAHAWRLSFTRVRP